MSNKDIVKGAYAAFATGDLPNVLSALSEDIDWNAVEVDGLAGKRKGHDDLVEFFGGLLTTYEPFTVTPDRFVEDGDLVIVIGHHVFENDSVPFVHVFEMADGKGKTFTEYVDSAPLAKHKL